MWLLWAARPAGLLSPSASPLACALQDVLCNGAGRYLSIQRLSRPADADSRVLSLREVQVGNCAYAGALTCAWLVPATDG